MKRLLKDVVVQQRSSLKLSDVAESGKYPVFGAAGLVGYRNTYQTDLPSVAIIKDGAGIGRVSLLPKNSSVLGTMQMLTPNADVDNVFLYYYLTHLRLGKSFTGSTIPHIYFKNYGASSFSKFKHDEQVRIAIDLTNISNAIENKHVQLTMLDGLVKSRFMEMFGDPISNSKQWPTEPLSECCKMNGIKKYPEQEKYWILNLDKIESGTGAVLAKDYASIDMVGNSTFFFDESYVLYSKLRPYLNKVALPDEPGFATTELVPLKPASYINRTFLATLLRSESFVAWIDNTSSGAKMPRASMDSLRGFKVIVPPITLQNDFANFVNLIDKSRFIVQSQIKDLQELLDSKMDEYFGGDEE